MQAARIHRERPVFSGVGGKFVECDVECEPDGLRGSRIQTQLGAVHDNTRANEIGEGRELGANQVLDLDPMPCIADEEVHLL
jgi:hypothetical protein